MKSPSLDFLYTQLDKHILLAQSYTEISDLSFIIRACRLKPYSYCFENKNNKLILHRHWFDEFGNSFKITTNKRISITYNDLKLDRSKIVSTDLYYGLSLDKISKISKLALIYSGKDEDQYNDCAIITFLGLDNYLRSYMLMYGEWKQVSPLLIGMKNLKNISQNKDIKYFKELNKKDGAIIPCISAEAWLTSIPTNKIFSSIMSRKYDTLYSFLNNTKE
jgi:hypothetical protein